MGRYDSGWQVSKAAHIGRTVRTACKTLRATLDIINGSGLPPPGSLPETGKRLIFIVALPTTRVLGFRVVTKRRSSEEMLPCVWLLRISADLAVGDVGKTVRGVRGNAGVDIMYELKCRLVGRSNDRLIATNYLVKPSPHSPVAKWLRYLTLTQTACLVDRTPVQIRPGPPNPKAGRAHG